MRIHRLVIGSVVLLVAATSGLAQPEKKPDGTSYLRFRDTGEREGVLETAIGRFRNDAGVEVDLVAAVHIADKSYYEKLNRRFAGYDAVLYEMVKPKGADPTRRSGGSISFLQRTMKDILDLEFQLDAVDYSPENFVHADMDPSTFTREQKSSGESLFKLMVKSALKEWKNQFKGKGNSMSTMEILGALMAEDSARALKYLFARQMEKADDMLSGLGGKDGTVIIEGRNKVAVQELRKQMEAGKKKLAIFYGGGHMPDLARRIEKEFGMKKAGEEWLMAWDIRSPTTREKDANRKNGTGEKKRREV